MTVEHKSLSLELKLHGETGEVTGYGSAFDNVDSQGDMIQRGAFAASIAKRAPKMLWQHDQRDVMGVWSEAKEDDRGLWLKGQILIDTNRGSDAYKFIKAGAIDSLSVGYRVKDFEFQGAVRVLKEIDLFEVSFVTIPANDQAVITDVKSMTPRDFEAMLRANGFTQREAKAIHAKGYKGLTGGLRDVAPAEPEYEQRDVDGLKAALDELSNTLGGAK